MTEYFIFNPNNVDIETLPIIYGYVHPKNSKNSSLGVALSQDGKILTRKFCSARGYILSDLGFLENDRQSSRVIYAEHYPQGYRTVFVMPDEDSAGHSGLEEAREKHTPPHLITRDKRGIPIRVGDLLKIKAKDFLRVKYQYVFVSQMVWSDVFTINDGRIREELYVDSLGAVINNVRISTDEGRLEDYEIIQSIGVDSHKKRLRIK